VIFFQDGLYDVGIQILYPIIMIIGIVLKLRTLWLYSAITLLWFVLMIYVDSLGFYATNESNDPPLIKGLIIVSMYVLSIILLRYFVQTTLVANQRLSQAKVAADEANRLKSSFLATMSHELRTPLNAIIGYSEDVMDIASGQPDFDPNISSDVARIKQSGTHLLTLINDILDFSKLEAGQMELYIQAVDPNQVISQVIKRVEPLAKKNQNKLSLLSNNLDVPIYTDRDKLRQICFNLISNATKYTHQGGVAIQLSTLEHGKLRVIVSDSGIGISSEKLPSIYDTFQQVDGSLSRSVEGTGLGLAITKRLVSLLGGIITVESEVGVGTTFTVVLPNLSQN
ncbi:MAG: ATP-binding protein, partial [Chloroflexota bacterium]